MNDTSGLLITLILAAYGFAAGGYYFTFKYVQSTYKEWLEVIRDTRAELKVEIEKAQQIINLVVANELRNLKADLHTFHVNDLRHLEERVERLEQTE